MAGMEQVKGAVNVHDAGARRRGDAVGELHNAPAGRHEAADGGVAGPPAAAAVPIVKLVQRHTLLPAAELLRQLSPLLQRPQMGKDAVLWELSQQFERYSSHGLMLLWLGPLPSCRCSPLSPSHPDLSASLAAK